MPLRIVRPLNPFADRIPASPLTRPPMPRALLTKAALFLAATALSGCGLFKFGTIEFLSDGAANSTDADDMGTRVEDGGSSSKDLATPPPVCVPTLLKALNAGWQGMQTGDNTQCSTSDSYKWNAYSIQQPTSGNKERHCTLTMETVDIASVAPNELLFLNIEYSVSLITGSWTLQKPMQIAPHITDCPSGTSIPCPVPNFDFIPNVSSGLHSASIYFQPQNSKVNLILDLFVAQAWNPTDFPKMTWAITKLALFKACPQ